MPACVRYSKWPLEKKLDRRILFIDVAPTLLNLAGFDAAGMENPLDGFDLTPILSGAAKKLPERDLFFYNGQQGAEKERYAIISGQWKLVINGLTLRRAVLIHRRWNYSTS